MEDQDAWSILGIKPSSDPREIRQAYARKLKVIDVEAKPKAFIRLREAFEQASNEAEWMTDAFQENAHIRDDEAENETDADATAISQLDDEDDWDDWEDWQPAPPYDWQAAQQRLNSTELIRLSDIILANNNSVGPVNEYDVDTLVKALWNAPENQQLDRYEELEAYLGHLIMSQPHRARFLLRKANWFYGWSTQDEDVIDHSFDRFEMKSWANAERLLRQYESDGFAYQAKTITQFEQGPKGRKWRDRWVRTKMAKIDAELCNEHYDASRLIAPQHWDFWENVTPIQIRWDIIIILSLGGVLAAWMPSGLASGARSLARFFIDYALYIALEIAALQTAKWLKQRYDDRCYDEAGWIIDLPLLRFEWIAAIALFLCVAIAPLWTGGQVPYVLTVFGLIIVSGLFWGGPQSGVRQRYTILILLYLLVEVTKAPENPLSFVNAVTIWPLGFALCAFGFGQPRLVESWAQMPSFILFLLRASILLVALSIGGWIIFNEVQKTTPIFLIWPIAMLALAQDALGESKHGPFMPSILGYSPMVPMILLGMTYFPSIIMLVLTSRRMAARLLDQFKEFKSNGQKAGVQ